MISISQNGGIVYFREDRVNIQYSTDNLNWINVNELLINITNTTPSPNNVLIVQFITNLTFISNNFYFICGSSYITFDGQNHTCMFNNIAGYLGLIQNGTSTEIGFSNIVVKNIHTETSDVDTTLANNSGWICQSYFGKSASNVLIDKCSSTGIITNCNGGGICGTYAGSETSGNITISNCYSTGEISGQESSGICGNGAGSGGGHATIENCYSTGEISGQESSGICGNGAGSNGGNITVENCYSKGVISGINAGGICGSGAGSVDGLATIKKCYSSGEISGNASSGICGYYAGAHNNGIAIVTNCYSEGAISGYYSGGICGFYAGSSTGNITVENCYSSGEISGQYAGGICGPFAGDSGKAIIKNCYSSGTITGLDAGGICGQRAGNSGGQTTITNCYSSGEIENIDYGIVGPNSNTSTISHCYIANNHWVDDLAKLPDALTGTPDSLSISGETWSSNDINTPYLLVSLIPYTPTITWISSITKTYGDIPFQIAAVNSDSIGSFSYTSSNSSVATVSENIITIVGAGNSNITATQASTNNYTSRTITVTLQVIKGTPILGNFNIPTKTYGNGPFKITHPNSTNTTPGSFIYISSNKQVATILENIVIIKGIGSSTIIATQAATDNYNPATTNTQFVVNKATPNITNNLNSFQQKTYGINPFTVPAPAPSDGAFRYTSTDTSVSNHFKSSHSNQHNNLKSWFFNNSSKKK